MALPEITLPAGVPNFVAPSQQFGELEVYGDAPRGAGDARKRRLKTKAPRVISVTSKKLTQAQMAAVDDWYEDVLLAGKRQWAVQLSNQGAGVLWWTARWVEPYKADPSKGRWVITGKLHLTGEGSVDPPVITSLAFEYRLPLVGRVAIDGSSALAIEYFLRLLPDAPLAFEYSVALAQAIYLEREDGTDFEREDGISRIQREQP